MTIKYVIGKKGDILITDHRVRQKISNGRIIIARPRDRAKILLQSANKPDIVVECLRVVMEKEKVAFAVVREECDPRVVEERVKRVLRRAVTAIWTARSLLDLVRVREKFLVGLAKFGCSIRWYVADESYWDIVELVLYCDLLGTKSIALETPLLPPPSRALSLAEWLSTTGSCTVQDREDLEDLLRCLGHALQYRLLHFRDRIEAVAKQWPLPWRL